MCQIIVLIRFPMINIKRITERKIYLKARFTIARFFCVLLKFVDLLKFVIFQYFTIKLHNTWQIVILST